LFAEGWRGRWVDSIYKGSEAGAFKWAAPKYYHNEDEAKGIKTSEDSKFYAISAKFPEKFSNKDKDLVIQFQVQHEQNIDCGGGYVKVCLWHG
jgi:calreticulin